MRHARARLTALALLAALAAGCKPAAARPDPAAELRPGPTTAGRPELSCGHPDARRCPPAPRPPAATLAEPGYVPKPAGPPQPPAAASRR
jgi:hypothetical protein